jgi:hypothetical protein
MSKIDSWILLVTLVLLCSECKSNFSTTFSEFNIERSRPIARMSCSIREDCTKILNSCREMLNTLITLSRHVRLTAAKHPCTNSDSEQEGVPYEPRSCFAKNFSVAFIIYLRACSLCCQF